MKVRHLTPALILLALALPLCAATPASQPALSSQAVVQAATRDGVASPNLQLSAVLTLDRPACAADEPVKFTVELKNVGKSPTALVGARNYSTWQILFTKVQEANAAREIWSVLFPLSARRAPKPATDELPVNATVTVPVTLDPAAKQFLFAWAGDADRLVQSVPQLPPGKYQLSISMTLHDDPMEPQLRRPDWTGTITTGPIAIEITPAAKAK